MRCALALLCLRLATAQPQPRLEPGFHTGNITSLAMDSAERFLVTASDDRTVRVWDLPAFPQPGLRQLQVLRLPAGSLNESRMFTAAIAPDGSVIAAAGPGSHSIYLYDRASGHLLRRLSGLPHVAFHLAYSPDGRYLLAALTDGGIRLYRTSGYTPAADDATYRGTVYCAAFSPTFAADGLLATGAEDQFVRLYRVRPDGRLQLLRRHIPEQKEAPIALAFSPDGRKLAVSLQYPNGYPEVEVWQPDTLARQYRALPLNAMSGNADSLAWSADGRQLYFAGDLAAGSPNSLIVRVGHGGRDDPFETVRACGEDRKCYITALLPRRDGSLLFASADQNGIGVVNPQWKLERYRPAPLPAYQGLADYGRFLLSADGLTVRFAYRQDGADPAWFSVARRSLAPGADVPGFTGAPPDDHSVDLRGLGTAEVLFQDKPLALDDETGLRVAAFAGGRRFLLATQWSLFLFDAAGVRQWSAALPASAAAIHASADGRFAVAALGDGTIRWYRAADGAELLALFPHPDRQRWVLWTPEGYYDCSPAGDELLGFETSRGEDQPPEFQPAAQLRSKYFQPEKVSKALQ